MDRGRKGTRLLDNNRKGADGRSFRRPYGSLGKTARDGGRVRGTTYLRLAQFHHVFAEGLLFFCSAEEKGSGDLFFPGKNNQEPSRAQNAPGIKSEGRAYCSHHASRPGRVTVHRLA